MVAQSAKNRQIWSHCLPVSQHLHLESVQFFQVVKQLNMAVILKGRDGPVYEKEDLKNFCLVAVIGSRERCLRDDFRPLNLQVQKY